MAQNVQVRSRCSPRFAKLARCRVTLAPFVATAIAAEPPPSVAPIHYFDEPRVYASAPSDAQDPIDLPTDIAALDPRLVAPDGSPLRLTEYILVGRDPNAPPSTLAAALVDHVPHARLTAAPHLPATMIRLRVPTVDGWRVLSTAAILANDVRVRFAEPDLIFTGHGTLIPNDPLFPPAWHLDNRGQTNGTPDIDLGAVDSWNITRGSNSTPVLTIDTGVDFAHPDLHVVRGVDLTGEGGFGEPHNPCDRHGTVVAGLSGAHINNALGVVGVAPQSPIVSARAMIAADACDGTWISQVSWTVSALAWAEQQGIRITSNSNSYGFTSAAIDAQYADTAARGMVHFASAGNTGDANISYPARLASVIAVGAIDSRGDRPTFGSFGAGLELVAPGLDVWTTDRVGAAGYVDGDYLAIDGTSASAPLAAGVAALVLADDPYLTGAEVRDRLVNTVMDLGKAGWDRQHGFGLVRADRALWCDLPGDLNDDDVVDSTDLSRLLANYGASFDAAPTDGDLDADGDVDSEDLDRLLSQFGRMCD